ncbi:filaggrin-2-like isoform X2 [Cydia pomonella]|uniref:filaggrin-2-like isoform X2 n=1 Tax=Cydia pomonella TaxID=82600 RepID=UPI002ADD334C|nr:filaggrin-2-like isoform X2 [Cydia pomonella]
MLRAVSRLCCDGQALEALARRDAYKLFRSAVHTTSTAHNTHNAAGETVLTSAAAAEPPAASAGPAPPPPRRAPPPPPPPPPRRSWVAVAAAVALTSSLGGVYYFSKIKDDTTKKEVKKLKPKDEQEEEGPLYPASGAELPAHVEFLVVGGGTAAFAALRALRAARPDAALLLAGAERAPPYMRPPLSKELWRRPELAAAAADPLSLAFTQYNGKQRRLVYEPLSFYTPLEKLREGGAGAGLARGWRVTRLDLAARSAELSAPGQDPATVTFDKCLIATGSVAKRLPALAPAAAAGRALALHSVRDVARLARALQEPGATRVVVVGAGLLAAELAAALAERARGSALEVVQLCREAAPLDELLPAYLAADAARRLRALGVTLLPDREISSSSVKDGRVHLRLRRAGAEAGGGAGAEAELAADVVVECVGADPSVELAEPAGLELHPELGGIVVNAELQARSNVWAAGDVACFHDVTLGRRRVTHHDHAVLSGRRAAQNMAGRAPPEPYAHQSMFWSDLGPQLGYEVHTHTPVGTEHGRPRAARALRAPEHVLERPGPAAGLRGTHTHTCRDRTRPAARRPSPTRTRACSGATWARSWATRYTHTHLSGQNTAGRAPPEPYAHQSMFWSDLGPQLGYEVHTHTPVGTEHGRPRAARALRAPEHVLERPGPAAGLRGTHTHTPVGTEHGRPRAARALRAPEHVLERPGPAAGLRGTHTHTCRDRTRPAARRPSPTRTRACSGATWARSWATRYTHTHTPVGTEHGRPRAARALRAPEHVLERPGPAAGLRGTHTHTCRDRTRPAARRPSPTRTRACSGATWARSWATRYTHTHLSGQNTAGRAPPEPYAHQSMFWSDLGPQLGYEVHTHTPVGTEHGRPRAARALRAPEHVLERPGPAAGLRGTHTHTCRDRTRPAARRPSPTRTRACSGATWARSWATRYTHTHLSGQNTAGRAPPEPYAHQSMFWSDLGPQLGYEVHTHTHLSGQNTAGRAPPEPYAHQSMFWSDLGPQLGYEVHTHTPVGTEHGRPRAARALRAPEHVLERPGPAAGLRGTHTHLSGQNTAGRAPPEPYAHQSMFWSDLGPQLGYEVHTHTPVGTEHGRPRAARALRAPEHVLERPGPAAGLRGTHTHTPVGTEHGRPRAARALRAPEHVLERPGPAAGLRGTHTHTCRDRTRPAARRPSPTRTRACSGATWARSWATRYTHTHLSGQNTAGRAPPEPYAHQSMFWSDLGPQLGYEVTAAHTHTHTPVGKEHGRPRAARALRAPEACSGATWARSRATR